MTNPSPTVRRRLLASELRRLRAAAGLTQEQAEQASGLSETSLTRYETCRSSISVVAAKALLAVYGVEGEQRDALLELARGARSRGWLRGFKGVVPRWLEDLVGLEGDASWIHQYATRVVPGYLQTEPYARAVLSAGIPGADVEQHVQARMARAAILEGDAPPEYWLVLCESALRVLVGGRHVMREQLHHIAAVAKRPNVTVQVLPDDHGAHMDMSIPFTFLGFDQAPEFSVVYMDYPTGSLYRDEPDEVEEYHRLYRHLIKAALPDTRSLDLITRRAKELA